MRCLLHSQLRLKLRRIQSGQYLPCGNGVVEINQDRLHRAGEFRGNFNQVCGFNCAGCGHRDAQTTLAHGFGLVGHGAAHLDLGVPPQITTEKSRSKYQIIDPARH